MMLTLTSISATRAVVLTALAAGFLAICGVAPARAQTVVAVVAGSPITEFEIEQRMKLAGLRAARTYWKS